MGGGEVCVCEKSESGARACGILVLADLITTVMLHLTNKRRL